MPAAIGPRSKPSPGRTWPSRRSPGGRGDEPLDIGTIPLEVFPFRNPGVDDRVPAIAAKAADGRPLDLAALRGKVVLLVFWHSSQTMSRSFIPPVKATWDAFGRDPRLAVIGLNQDATPEVMRRYLAGKGLDWDHRYLGDLEDPDPIAAAFGVRYPGGVFLIGPDGRIIARDLQGDGIQQAVARARRAIPVGRMWRGENPGGTGGPMDPDSGAEIPARRQRF